MALNRSEEAYICPYCQDITTKTETPDCDTSPCEKCNNAWVRTGMSVEDYYVICDATGYDNDEYHIKIMELKKTDFLQYELLMGTFREKNKIERQRRQAETESRNAKRCPKCGSTNLTPVRKKWSLLTGFATNKVELICNKCGAKVK